MRILSILVIASAILFHSGVSYAKGSWFIVITETSSGDYVAMLKNTYDEYYDKIVEGNFQSASAAEAAANQFRSDYIASGASAEPADCFFQSDLL
jgi:hypothetical protein